MIERNILPGKECLYLKIYGGPTSLDNLLAEKIFSLIHELKETEDISKWFFVRYNDPDTHLRVRLFDLKNFEFSLVKFTDMLKPFIDNGIVNNIQIDVYKREVERYGKALYHYSEEFFNIDSIVVSDFLNRNENPDDRQRWLFSIFYINTILKLAIDDDLDRFEFLKKMNKLYSQEFNLNKERSDILSKQFREWRNFDFRSFYDQSCKDEIGKIETLINNLKMDSAFNNNFFIDSILPSWIHMSVNRLFVMNQRLYEFMIFNFLFRLHKQNLNKKAVVGDINSSISS